MNLAVPQLVLSAIKTLQNKGFSAYLVGGCVRDLILGREPADWDIATDAEPEQIIELFPKTFYENKFGTVTIDNGEGAPKKHRFIEVTPFRLETNYSDQRHPDSVRWSKKLEDDLSRRDFTINALAYDPIKSVIIDLFNGQNDLKKQKIKTVGSATDRFREDPLRMLRAIRFAGQLCFTIDLDTTEAIQLLAPEIAKISHERTRDEFIKLILSPNPTIGLVLSHKLGLMGQFLPELEQGIGMKQNSDHIFDVWEHTLRVAQHAADRNANLEVRLAALFHDIGKPPTRRWSEEKKDWTFYGHEVVGAKITNRILKRLKFPVKTTENVTKLVRNHMFFTDIDKISLSAVRRIIRNVGPELVWKLMEVRMCDRIGMGRPKESPYRLRKYESMIEEAMRAPTSVGMLKIGGEDVLRVTKIPPGPKIGHILHALLEEVLDDPKLNKTEYLTKRSKELAKMNENELKKLGEKGKERKGEVEEQELEKIRKKFRVK